MGGGKKRGVENLTNDTPPKKVFWTPPRTVRFPPLRCQCSVFPIQKSTTEQTRSSFVRVQTFSGERVLWYVFLPPYVLHPPISRPKKLQSFHEWSTWVNSCELPRFESTSQSREAHSPKKAPTWTKAGCTNSLRKLFGLFSVFFWRQKRGDSERKRVDSLLQT